MSSQRFLMIETGTEICSVALSYGDSVSDEIVIREPRSHTRVLGSIIDELLKRNRITFWCFALTFIAPRSVSTSINFQWTVL